MTLEQAHIVLGLNPGGENVTGKLVEVAVKVRRFETHPDKRGGSHESALLVNAAYDKLKAAYGAGP